MACVSITTGKMGGYVVQDTTDMLLGTDSLADVSRFIHNYFDPDRVVSAAPEDRAARAERLHDPARVVAQALYDCGFLSRDNFIRSIKCVRAITGVSLKTAKNAVDFFLD